MDARAIGVFDSGVGGLTVLHECLVTMPHEDFVYLGDHARLPYGPRPLDEVRQFASEIGTFLQAQGVKLVVNACNAADVAVLQALTTSFTPCAWRKVPISEANCRTSSSGRGPYGNRAW